MPPPDEKSKIEGLKESLYSRNAPDVRTRRKLRFTEEDSTVQKSWNDSEEEVHIPVTLNTDYKDHSMSFFTKLLIGSGLFCIIALSAGAFLFFKGSNLISADNIEINISGPISIPGGEPVSFDIQVINKNNVDLQTADLEVDFPEGTIDPENQSQELKIYREVLGDMKSGASVTKTVKAIVFGEENLQKQITFGVTYRVKGSTALFTKKKSYDVLINSSPVVLNVSSFKEVTSGQEFEMTVSLKSNSQQTLKNVLVKAQYPFGYTYLSSSVATVGSSNVWKIGDIPAGAERKIVIKGNLKGENTDSRIFRFSAGAQSSTDPKNIGTHYMTAEQALTIQKPFLSVGIAVNNDEATTDRSAVPGENQRIKISWFNNLDTAVSNVEITAKLAGTAYDRTAVIPDEGNFRSVDNEIVWNQQTTPDLASIGAGESGDVSFSLVPKDPSTSLNPITNAMLTVTAHVTANRTGQSQVSGNITSAATRTVRLASHTTLTGRVLRSTGPFINSGPVPPRADAVTTYTIMWSIDNTSNPLSNAVVVAALPPYVKWIGSSPSSADITYDSNKGTITWNAGTVGTYTRSSGRTKEVSFQVSFQPNLNQRGQTPVILNAAALTASDDFAGVTLESKQDTLSTRFSTDPTFKVGDEIVAQ